MTANGRLLKVQLSSPLSAQGQLLKVQLTTPAFTVVNLGSGRAVDGLELVTIDATYVGAAPTSWTWSIISDPSGQTVLDPTGAHCEFHAPATTQGVTVQIGARANNGTTTSALATATFTVYPHLFWLMESNVWVPRRRDLISL